MTASMMILNMNTLRCYVLLLLAFFTTSVVANEVRVFASGAAKHAVEALAPAFYKATGHTLHASYDTVGALTSRVLLAPPGEATDVVILSDAALASLGAAGRLSAVPAHRIGRVVVAIAVKQGTPVPDVSTSDALRQALLTAPSVAYGDPARGATAGTHFAKVITTLGLGDLLKGKITVLPFGVDVIAGVAEGRYALGISQSSEIRQYRGISYAGPLPAPYGLSTAYGAALTSESAAARQFLTFLNSDEALREFEGSGFVQAKD